MTPKFKTFLFSALVAFAISACEPKLDAPSPSAGPADFSRYVAFGNSLTAGYSDNGLYLEGQLNSYPNILAQQFKAAGGGDFEQPLFSSTQANGSGYIKLAGLANGLPNLQIVATEVAYIDASLKKLAPYTPLSANTPQNLGIPGIRLADIATPGYGDASESNYNQYFERLQPGRATYTHVAAQSRPTFFTSWLGNNDVLAFAGAGGDVNNDSITDFAALTAPAQFETLYIAFLDSVKANAPNAKGLLSNIPAVTATPFFTTLKPSFIIANAKKTNPTANDIWIKTSNNTRRIATDEDLVLLTTQAVLGRLDTVNYPTQGRIPVPHGFDRFNALNNNEVLDKDEVAAIASRTVELNNIIKRLAENRNLAHWDANNFLNQIAGNGFIESGISLTSSFISGGIFSLDGVHLTPRGYAIAANQMIMAINEKYGSNISTVDVSKYRSVKFP